MQGTIEVDFVGSAADLVEFIEANGESFPNGLGIKTGGEYKVLVAKYKSEKEKAAVVHAFDSLGWDEGSQLLA